MMEEYTEKPGQTDDTGCLRCLPYHRFSTGTTDRKAIKASFVKSNK
jgi:hypothetical protein